MPAAPLGHGVMLASIERPHGDQVERMAAVTTTAVTAMSSMVCMDPPRR